MKVPSFENDNLTGQILIASPQMTDPRFAHTIILICGHDQNGAMGLVLNRLVEELTLQDLLEQLDVSASKYISNTPIPIYFGGPIEMGRGFVLHSTDYLHEASVKISDSLALTSTIEVLSLISQGLGPEKRILALGYAGWSTGQLEAEIQKNSWLQVEADLDLVFSPYLSDKWQNALAKIGVDPSLLSAQCGHA